MDSSAQKSPQTISLWITSLAISVTCCAVLFVIFAGYLNDIKKQITAESEQLEQMTVHQDKLLAEIQALQKTISTAQTGGPAPTGVVVPVPATATPPVATDAPVAPSPITTPATVTPPPASPTAIPEVPAKK